MYGPPTTTVNALIKAAASISIRVLDLRLQLESDLYQRATSISLVHILTEFSYFKSTNQGDLKTRDFEKSVYFTKYSEILR